MKIMSIDYFQWHLIKLARYSARINTSKSENDTEDRISEQQY